MRGNVSTLNDVSATVIHGATDDMLDGMEIVAVTTVVVASELIVKVSRAIELLSGMCSGPCVGNEMNASDLAAVITALEVALPAPLVKSFVCFRAACSSCSMTILNFRVLQACMPSCHV